MAKKITKAQFVGKAADLTIFKQVMDTALDTAKKLKVKKFEDVMDAADFLFEVKAIAEKVETGKADLLKPFNDGVKNLRKVFKPIEENYTDAEKLAKDKILDWHQSQWDKGTQTDNKISGLFGNVTVVERSRVQVDDAELIPREFCMPDPEKLEYALKAGIKVNGASLMPTYSITAGKN